MRDRVRAQLFDAALALLMLVVALPQHVRLQHDAPRWHAGLALVLLHTLPLAARRRLPLVVHGVSVAAAFGYLALGFPTVGLGLAVLVVVYTTAALRPRRESLAALAVTVALLAAAPGLDMDAGTAAGNLLVLLAAWALGDAARQRAERAVAAREEAARRAVADERLRIARELHDVVAHTLGVVAVQAGAARLVVADDPERAAAALDTIETTTRGALAEMRTLLGVLRADGEGAALAPQPGLAGLTVLVAQVADAGVPVRLSVEGEQRPLPPGLEVSAYRIVQEALTNVIRHADRAPATVVVRYAADRLEVEVTDEGPGPAATPAPGHGIVGMRERVAVYGGTLVAEPRPGGGFRVAASFSLAEGGRDAAAPAGGRGVRVGDAP